MFKTRNDFELDDATSKVTAEDMELEKLEPSDLELEED